MPQSAPFIRAWTCAEGVESRRQGSACDLVVVVNLSDLADKLHAIPASVVDATDEGGDEGGSGLGGEVGLCRREAERDVDRDAFVAQCAARSESRLGQRDLDDDVVMDLARRRPCSNMPSLSRATTLH